MYSFICYGHGNISSSHKATLEFTKDREITRMGHCIVGVRADFELDRIKRLVKDKKKLKIVIRAGDIKDEINCLVNPGFDDDRELVVRRSDFSSKRTLGIRCDKASAGLSGLLKEKLSDPGQKIIITLI